MQVTQTNADGLKHEFKVVVPAGHIEEQVNGKLVEVGRSAKLPGFRPGKVPMPMLRKRYLSNVMGEVLESVVSDGTQKALTEHNLRPAMQPKVEITSFQEGGDLEFTVAVEILPSVQPMDFKTIKLERPKVVVTDEMVEASLRRLAERQKSSDPIEEARPARTGDIAVIDFLGKREGVPFDGGAGTDFPLELGSGSFIPGFEDQLVGAEVGQTLTVAVTFPESYGSPELAGQPAEFEVTVKELRQPVAATLDDELAKKFGMDSLDALKTALRDEMDRDFGQMSRGRLKRQLLDALSDGHDFAVPPTMVDMEFDAIWKQLEADKEAGRLDDDDKDKSEDDLKAEYRAIAERRVRLGLLLAEVGRDSKVTLTQEDLNRALMTEARRFPGQEHLVFQYYQKNQEAMNALRAPVYEDKVVDYILEQTDITDKPVSIEELTNEVAGKGDGAEVAA